MNFPLLSHRRTLPILYASETAFESAVLPPVRFVLHRISAARRLDLLACMGELASQLEMLQASGSLDDRVQAEALRIQIDREYLRWGLKELRGLEIDGVPAEAESLFERGPEDLMNEIVSRIRAECELSGEERKN